MRGTCTRGSSCKFRHVGEPGPGPARGGRGGGGDRYEPYRRPVDDDPYDRYVSLWQIVCFVSHEIFVLCRLQGIINMNNNGNSANFFSCVCNGKKIKELFASTLNGIPSSVKCVSSMIVVLNAKFARTCGTRERKRR